VVLGNDGKPLGLLGSPVGGCACPLPIKVIKNKQDIRDSFFIYLVTVPEFINISWGLIFKNFDGKDNILF
jgi:hypothetical protein